MRGFESWILSYLLNSLWQIPLLLGAGWIAARVLRPAGPAVEHRVWVSVLLLQCFLPACSGLRWEWLRACFAPVGGVYPSGEAHVSVMIGAGTGFSALHLPATLLMAIAIAYSAGTACFAARFVWRWARLSVMRREAMEVALTDEAARYRARCSEMFGIDEVLIAASSQIFGPVTMGVFRKIVLLPTAMAARLPESDLHTVIAHEFAHVDRNDFLKNLIYEVLSLPASYHPLFWLTRERIMESREMVCDQMAAAISGRNEYARSLLRLASLLVEGMSTRTSHAIGIFDANVLERRLMKLTGKEHTLQGMRRLAVVTACAALGLVTCGSALALSLHVDGIASASDRSAPKTAGPMKVSARVMGGHRLRGPIPKYPEAAKKAKIQGKVVLSAVIGKDGSVEKLAVVSGPKELRESSLDAVWQWKYSPLLLNGNPVEVKTTINVVYSLRK